MRCHASCSCSSSTDGGSAVSAVSTGRRLHGRRLGDCPLGSAAAAAFELVEAKCQCFAGHVRRGARDLHERELERQARIAALAHVVHGHGEQVDQPHDDRRAELVRLRREPVARLLGQRQRVGHLAHVLDEHQRAQVLEQVEHEPADVLPLRRELLDERQRAGGVAVDDEVAEPEQRLLLDRAEQLQDVLDRDPALGRGGELVERRLGVAVRAARAACDRARAPGPARRSSPRPRSAAASARAPRTAAAGRRTSGSASARSARPSRGRSCRRRRRGAAAAPRSASAARSTPRP